MPCRVDCQGKGTRSLPDCLSAGGTEAAAAVVADGFRGVVVDEFGVFVASDDHLGDAVAFLDVEGAVGIILGVQEKGGTEQGLEGVICELGWVGDAVAQADGAMVVRIR